MRTPPGWIFVLAAIHRTGSTFLQRLVNASEEAHLWGETGFGPPLFQLSCQLQKAAGRGGDEQRRTFLSGERDIWMAHMVPEQARIQDALRKLLEDMFGMDGKRVGTKEVLYTGEVIRFLAELLPGARFLLITRNPLDCYLSYKNTGWPDQDRQRFAGNWAHRTALYHRLAQEDPGRMLFLRHEELDEAQCRRIYDFLDLTYTPAVAAVAERRLGGSKKSAGLDDEEQALLRRVCAETYRATYGKEL